MNENDPLQKGIHGGVESIFSIRGDLDGDQQTEFVEREQFIGLIIGNEEFLLSITAVREIIMIVPITFVPNSPPFVDGVINLRGTILPAINMRKLMGLSRSEPSPSARIIVVRVDEVNCALLVDGITYVVSLLPSEIEVQNLPGKGTGAEFIASIAKQVNVSRVIGILDLQRVIKTLLPDGTADDQEEAA